MSIPPWQENVKHRRRIRWGNHRIRHIPSKTEDQRPDTNGGKLHSGKGNHQQTQTHFGHTPAKLPHHLHGSGNHQPTEKAHRKGHRKITIHHLQNPYHNQPHRGHLGNPIIPQLPSITNKGEPRSHQPYQRSHGIITTPRQTRTNPGTLERQIRTHKASPKKKRPKPTPNRPQRDTESRNTPTKPNQKTIQRTNHPPQLDFLIRHTPHLHRTNNNIRIQIQQEAQWHLSRIKKGVHQQHQRKRHRRMGKRNTRNNP